MNIEWSEHWEEFDSNERDGSRRFRWTATVLPNAEEGKIADRPTDSWQVSDVERDKGIFTREGMQVHVGTGEIPDWLTDWQFTW